MQDFFKDKCMAMVRHGFRKVELETGNKFIYHDETWRLVEGLVIIAEDESLNGFLEKIEKIYEGCF